MSTKQEAVTDSRTVASITRAYIRHYSDNGQSTAYVEWSDGSRTEGSVHGNGVGFHMRSLLQRAVNNGLTIEHQTWGNPNSGINS